MSNNEEIEAQIVEKGLTAPRVTLDMVNAEVDDAVLENVVLFGVLTIVAPKLRNGFIVTGESACASPENFNSEIGFNIALDNARQKIWSHLGFRLRDQLQANVPANIPGDN